MKVIAIANQKGGVGKTSTAIALGLGLKQKGFKVLFVDLDAQGNLSYVFDSLGYENTSMDLLLNNKKIDDVIVNAKLGDIIPSGKNLSGADAKLTETGKEYKLKEALEPIKDRYDYVIVDSPPALGILTVNALVSANTVIVPIQADMFSIQGIQTLKQNVNAVKKYFNPDLSIDGILLTRFSPRSVLSREVCALIEENAKTIGTKVYNTKIRECISLKEAQAMKQDIFKYAPKSNASSDYLNFVNEFLGK